jgi:phosphate transport system substrate-binding protein
MMMRNKATGLVAVLAVAVVLIVAVSLIAAGCGSSEDTTTTMAPTTTSMADTNTSMADTNTSMAETTTTMAPLSADLNAAGATFPQPVYVEWIGAFQKVEPGVSINYQGVGYRFRSLRRVHEARRAPGR